MCKEFSVDIANIIVNPNVPFKVKLKGFGATGHIWRLVVDPRMVKVHKHITQPSVGGFGGTGEEYFILEKLRSGVTNLEFQLLAPWNEEINRIHHVRLLSDEEE